MKLRLDKKTVRIRASKEEIIQLQDHGYLEEHIYLNETNRFTYAIEVSSDSEECQLKIREFEMLVKIPKGKSKKWINSNQVGIKETFDTENGDSITIFVEEDLPPRKKK